MESMDVSELDLAAICADLVGATGTSAVLINRLSRYYSDAPNELRQLQSQATSAKLSLDQILSSLDSDPPAIQRQEDLIALNLYFSAIRAVVNDAQRHVARLESNATGQPGCSWSSVQNMWDSSEISASEERLMKQVKALGVYISIAKLDEKSQHLTKLRHKRDLDAARDDAFTYVDIGITTSLESPPPYELTIPTEGSSTSDGTYNASTRPSAASGFRNHSVGSARSPEASASPPILSGGNALSPARRPLSQPGSLDDQSGSSLALVGSRPQSTINTPLGPYLNTIAQRNGIGPSASTPSLANTTSPTNTSKASEDLPRTNSDGRTESGLSARKKKKSKALLRKENETPLFDGVQGDVLYPEEFRARVGMYNKALTPAWRPITLVGTTNKIRYRNRFTNDPADDIVKSNFKIGDKKLWDAVIHKETEKVEDIMQHRWSNNIVVEKQDSLTAIHMAASLGLCSIVQVLTKAGANPNSTDRFGLTPLHYAADFGCASCLQILVDAGAKVNGVPPKANIKPPIWYAAERGHVEATRTLLRLGAHFLNQITAIKETLLHVAVKSGSVPICQSLFAAGANPNESFSTLLMASSRSPDLLGCLRRAGADINMRDSGSQETLLHKYVAYGDVAMACYLLALGADPSLADAAGRTPLHTALLYGDLEAAGTLTRVLVKKGGDLNAQNARGQTPLHLAVLWGRADAVHILCQAGADQHVADEAGTTPWAEAQKPDYPARAATATTPAATATGYSSPLADFKKSRHIMGQWHGKPVRRKPTLTAELMAAADVHGGGIASPPLPSPGHHHHHHAAVQAQELEAYEPRHFAVELPA